MKIAIPRAGLYHLYHSFWVAFFETLGFEVVVSPPTDRNILEAGLKIANGEMCLPMKIMYGHILWLEDKGDFMLLPQMSEAKFGSAEPGSGNFFCPYFVGLADLMAAEFSDLKILRPKMGFHDGMVEPDPWLSLAQELGKSETEAAAAYAKASAAYQDFSVQQKNIKPAASGKTIALIGRPYVTYDDYANLNIVDKLANRGFAVKFWENIPENFLQAGLDQVSPRFRSHWFLTNREFGAINHLASQPDIAGIVYLVPFNCGPDFMIEEAVIQQARSRKPITMISLDESTGEAGLNTRLDAFIDMLK